MERISVRQLRQEASKWLEQVQAGRSFEVTDRGRPVALLVPLPLSPRDRFIAAGKIIPGKGNLLRVGPPLPPQLGVPLPSETLDQMRADER